MSHSHDIDGKLHDKCSACDAIRTARTRDYAYKSRDKLLNRLTESAEQANAIANRMRAGA